MSEIIRNVLLGTNQLIPNPKNPRKNIGDITELKKSIQKNGIMQNLMVMPVNEEYEKFIVLIGHRRLAAAKEIGILEVPCNEILANIKNRIDLKRRVDDFLRKQRQDKIFEECKIIFSEFRIKEKTNASPWDSKYDRIFSSNLDNEDLAGDIKDFLSNLQDTKSVFYIENYGSIYIMNQAKQKKTLSKEEKKKKELQKNRKSLLQLQKIKQKKRHDFIIDILPREKLKEKDKKYITEKSLKICLNGQGKSLSKRTISSYIQEKKPWEIDEANRNEILELESHLIMLMLADFNMQINDGTYMNIVDWNTKYDKSKADQIREVYELICKYGYELDDEELQLLNGTHELYNKEKNEKKRNNRMAE